MTLSDLKRLGIVLAAVPVVGALLAVAGVMALVSAALTPAWERRQQREAAEKADPRIAREWRKDLRRRAAQFSEELQARRAELINGALEIAALRNEVGARVATHGPEELREMRARVRDAELRYAIACARAGAVPGGKMVH